MPSASGLRAGRAVIEVTLLTKGVEAGLRKLQVRAKSIGERFSRIGTFGIAGGGFAGLRNLFVGSTAAAAAAWPVKLASNIELAAAQMSVFTGDTKLAKDQILELQKFSAFAFQDVEGLASQMRLLMTRDISAADAMEDIKALSVLAAGSTEEFEQLTKAFADVKSATRLNGEEMRQFKNTAFNPFIEIAKKTGETFQQLKSRMEAGGIAFEEVQFALRASVREGGLFHGMLEKISNTLIGQVRKAFAQFKMAVLPIGEELLGPITQFFKAINGVMPAFSNFVKANAGMVKVIMGAVAGVAVLAISFITLGLSMTIISIAAAGLASAIGFIASIFTASIGLPTLLAAAFAGLGVEFLRSSDAGRTMVTTLIGFFGQLAQTAKTTFAAIANALVAGDIQMAAQVLWTGLKLAWLQGTQRLMEQWRNFQDIAVRTFIELSFNVQSVWVKLVASLKSVWGEFTRWFQDAWDVIVTTLAKIGETDAVKAEMDRMLSEKVGTREQQSRADQGALTTQRDADLAAIEDARRQAHEFQSQQFNEELMAAAKALEDAKLKLRELSDASKVAADNVKNPDFFGDKNLANFMKGGLAAAKDAAFGKPEAFFDTRLAAQSVGSDVQARQLGELVRIRKAAEDQRPGDIPFV